MYRTSHAAHRLWLEKTQTTVMMDRSLGCSLNGDHLDQTLFFEKEKEGGNDNQYSSGPFRSVFFLLSILKFSLICTLNEYHMFPRTFRVTIILM